MAVRFIAGLSLVVCLISIGESLPLVDLLEDSEIVGSSVREVRAAEVYDLLQSPTNFHKEFDSGDDGDVGYARKKSDKGKQGYQKFDSFHKKDGDSYAFEKHDSFGHDEKEGDEEHDGEGAYSQKVENKKKKGQDQGKKSAAYQEGSDGSYDVIESDDDGEGDYSEGDSEGDYDGEDASDEIDGPVGGSGHDEADAVNYDIPSEYTYGAGEDYNFRRK